MINLTTALEEFRSAHRFKGKGPLCVALVVTRIAKDKGLPLAHEGLLTEGQGQVSKLGKAPVQNILRDHGITRVLAEEGGRTSRGSLGNMQKYVRFLNELHAQGTVNLDDVENWWIERVKEFFRGKPLSLRHAPGKSLSSIVSDLLAQAAARQKENPGATYAGTVLQHLVGAKLDLVLPDEKRVEHHGACVSDSSTARSGDFIVDNTAIHVTVAPGEALMRKCAENIESGLHPVVVTTAEGRPAAESQAKIQMIHGQVDIVEAEQFIATNIMEWGNFSAVSQREEIEKLIMRYNEIVSDVETDVSLCIQM